MPVRNIVTHAHHASLFIRRSALLATASVSALVVIGSGALARPLGGGAASPSPVSAAAVASQAAQVAASRAGTDAQIALQRAARSIQAMQATQQAARDAVRAQPTISVPNGLVSGGLQVGTGLWQGANLPTESTTGDRTNVVVKQTEQKAILEWSSFNVGARTELYFDQRAGGTNASEWIALNRVLDPSGAPSRILGSIRAEGQVYVVNRNGIIFGGASQVNVGSLVASSLSLSNEQFKAGIAKTLLAYGASDWSIAFPTFGDYGSLVDISRRAAQQPQPAFVPGPAPGDVTVEAGAVIAAAVGGKAMLFAPRVTNYGTISAQSGQVIMAAGEQVYLTPSSSVRGLDVAVSSVAPWLMPGSISFMPQYPGLAFTLDVHDLILPGMDRRAAEVGYRVTNAGIISSTRGDITMQGRDVVQAGFLYANTALNNQGGSVRLQAWSQGSLSYFIDDAPMLRSWRAGTLTLAERSVILVEPDLSDSSEIEGSALKTRYEPGRVELRGNEIHIKSDASVIVPAGNINILASAQPTAPLEPNSGLGGVADGSRVNIEANAYLSVAGLLDIAIAMERNVVDATLGINELRDSPLYRESTLRGLKVKVDRRNTGIFTDGVMAGVEWGGKPGEWAGSRLADLSAWIGNERRNLGELSTIGGSIFIKSGGSIVTRPGSIFDISGGSVRYRDGWIATTRLVGADGRIYDIGAAKPDQMYYALSNGFTRRHDRWGITETWTSIFDRSTARFERGYIEGRNAGIVTLYAGEAFVLEGKLAAGVVTGERQMSGKAAVAGTLKIGTDQTANAAWTPDHIIISDKPLALANDLSNLGQFYDAATGRATLYLDAGMFGDSGLGMLDLNVGAGFDVTEGAKIVLDPGATLAVNGTASFTLDPVHFNIDGGIRIAGGTVKFTGVIHQVSLGEKSVIDVSGQWINEANDGVVLTPQRTNGGTIDLRQIAISAKVGAMMDTSGGALYSRRGGKVGLKVGDAGLINLTNMDAKSLPHLDLRGYAAGSGGSLSISTNAAVQIGGDAPADDSVMYIGGALFSDRGFRSFGIGTTKGISLPDGARLNQLVTSIDLSAASVRTAASGTAMSDVGQLVVLPLWQRAALAANSLVVGAAADVIVGANASIATDVRGSIGISAANIKIDGTIEAPAGSITLGANRGNITLGNSAALLARGVPVYRPDQMGRQTGEVLDGGSVTLSSISYSMGTGTLIDVSGAAGVIDSPEKGAEKITLNSNGGSITLNGGGVIQGRLLAHAGGPKAMGGTLTVSNQGIDIGPSAFDMLKGLLENLVFDDTNGDGEYTWEDAIGFDISTMLTNGDGSSIFPSGGPFILTQEFVDAFRSVRVPAFTVTKIATAGGGYVAIDPTRYGLVREDILALRDQYFGGDPTFDLFKIGAVVAKTPPAPTLIESVANGGGFANLSLATFNTIELDAVNLSVGRSISIRGPVVSNGTSSTLTAPYIQMNGGTANASTTLAGALNLKSSQIDIRDANSIRGYQQTVMHSDSIRFTASNMNRTSGLTVDGDLVLKAGVIYPDSAINATIAAGSSITVQQDGAASLPLSAAGSLTLQAPVITQGGTLLAPFGSISLDASETLTLASGSLTSVSGAGLDALYGTLLNGESWQVNPGPGALVTIAAPPEKKITLKGKDVAVRGGAVVDISGGGDLHAWEFVPGPGGSHDILNLPGMYAILPSQASGASDTGQRVWLAGGNGLAAGWYTLLPARYALLPGAYAIQMVKGSESTWSATRSNILADGTVLMTGRLGDAFTGSADGLNSSWRVMSGNVLRQYTEYNEASANSFFASEAFKLTQYRETGQNIVTPRSPVDAGSVVFKATQELSLDGSLKSAAPGGRGGLVDIVATKIAVLGAGQNSAAFKADGYLVLDATSLSNFGASSLLIGGERAGDPRGMRLAVAASDIVIRNDANSALTGPEVILAASGQVDVGAGSVVLAKGEVAGRTGDIVVKPQVEPITDDPDGWEDNNPADDVVVVPSKDYGALIRVSTGDVARIVRENVDTTIGGVVSIGAGAQLGEGNALAIDATRTTNLSGTAQLSAASLSVSSGRIGLGGGSEGLVLLLPTLQQLASTQHLTLRSYSSIDFHQSVSFGGAGLARVTLDAGALAGYGNSNILVSGDIITLENSGGGTAVAGTGTGALALTARELILGSGTKTASGFNSVVLTGTNGIIGQGKGGFGGGTATVTLATPVLTGQQAANQSVSTKGALSLIGTGGTSTLTAMDSLGSILALSGRSVAIGGRIVAVGGAVNVTATAGNAVIDGGALIDVGGFAKQFFDVTEHAGAGRIGLTAIGGDVQVRSGAVLNLAAVAGGGNAGKLDVTASGGGTVALDGTIAAQAGAGGKGGSFALDIGALPDFAGLSDKLNASGFFASRQFRVRNGNVEIAGLTRVDDFALSADIGTVTITGMIDARTAYGGRIAITGGNGVVMRNSATLMAGATDGVLGSGRVTLDAAGGRLDVQGGTIDVSGGESGVVRFRAGRDAGPDLIKVDNLSANILGARLSVLEGVARYESTDGTVESQWGTAVSEANAFAGNAAAILGRLGSPVGVAVMAGIEITSNGDLALSSDLDLANTFGSSLRAGSLTLRAAGNLKINGNISDGFSDASTSGALLTGKSWDVRLVAGADLGAANALAVTPLAELPAAGGTITIGSDTAGKVIRTGTGDIAVAAGRDLRFANVASAIYTAGELDSRSYSDFAPKADAVYAIGGGHLNVAAGGDISVNIKSNEGQFFGWLLRTALLNRNDTFGSAPGDQSSWWVAHGAFQQGVGALGGGNVAVNAGGNLGNLVVALATSGRVHGGTTTPDDKVLQVDNGGAMTVSAGGAVLGGQYYTGRGDATIDAASFGIGRDVSYSSGGFATVVPLSPVLALGDASMTVTAAGTMRIQTVADPLLAYSPSFAPFMSGYTNRTAINLTSVGGDITLVNRSRGGNHFPVRDDNAYPSGSSVGRSGNRYPSKTRILALNGSIANWGLITTMPGSNPELRIMAAKDVALGGILMARISASAAPSPFRPSYDMDSFNGLLLNKATANSPGEPTTYVGGNPDRLDNIDDDEPSRIYALAGSIDGVDRGIVRSGTALNSDETGMTTSEQTWFRAGTDIRQINFRLRNLHSTDVTLIQAGNDIVSGVGNAVSGIEIQGPGALQVLAGRDIYAQRLDIYSVGNRTFSYSNNTPYFKSEIKGLPDQGADITLMAGINGDVGYDAFAATYLDPANTGKMPNWLTTDASGVRLPIYLTDATETSVGGAQHVSRRGLVSFVKHITGETLSPLDAWTRFGTLPEIVRQGFLRNVYMQELRAAGRDQNDTRETGGYNRGYAAISALFPGNGWKGNVQFGNGLVRTMSGGDIRVLAPGGELQVAALNSPVGAGFGLVTLGYGHIDIFADRNVVVNRSRILTFGGGDEIIWSTVGDIDAGRGAKTTRVPSKPEVLVDDDGNVRIVEKADIGGSGIGTIEGFEGAEPGDVDLIAPKGTVNAGDAGIRVAGNLNLAALRVLNAANIEVKGIAKGMPVVEVPDIGGLSEAANTAGSAAREAISPTQNQASAPPSVITVEVLGYGGGGNEQDERPKPRERQSQDLRNRYQVLGAGDLTEDQTAALASENRKLVGR